MKRLIAILFFVIAGPVFAAGQVTVTGTATQNAVPDMATISLSVTTENRVAAAALKANSQRTRAVLDTIGGLGIEARDMQTSGLSLQPVWNNRSSSKPNQPQIVGYRVTNQVTLRLRDLDLVGRVVDASVGDGANGFNGLTFGLQDPEPVMDEARKQAVADAIRKAQLYANAAGIVLGPLVSLQESGSARPVPQMMRETAMADSVPVVAGEVGLRASVTLVYEIAD